MLKRTDIIKILKTVDIERLENDGPTSVFFSTKGAKEKKTLSLSAQNEVIVVTTGKFLFKRRYIIRKNELQ
jgi:hypothetical protein